MKKLDSVSSFYQTLSIAEKFSFFLSSPHEDLERLNSIDLSKFLSAIALDQTENSNLRKRAVELHTEYILVKRIKTRRALSLLIDDWNDTQEVFLEVRRLKDLFLFFEEDSDSIREIYEEGKKSREPEIQSESLFRLGLLTFLESLKTCEREKSIVLLTSSAEFFYSSADSTENRVDAEYFCDVSNLLIDLLQHKQRMLPHYMKRLAHRLWNRQVFSLSNSIDPFEVGFYRTLFSLSKIIEIQPSSWLDYRKGFDDLYCFFCEINNKELKLRLFDSFIEEKFSSYIVAQAIEPYFILNFSAEKAKIEAMLDESQDSPGRQAFLTYVLNCATDEAKKKVDRKDILTMLVKAFPDKDSEVIKREILKAGDSSGVQTLLRLYNEFSAHTIEKFLDALISSCTSMQSNKMY